MAENVLNQMIEERSARTEKVRAQMAAFETELSALDAEIRVLQEAITRSGGASHKDEPQPEIRKSKRKRARPLKEEWADIMCFVGRCGEASVDDVMSYGLEKGYDLNRNTARSQFFQYRKEGWFESVRTGVVRLTPAGAEKCSFVPDEEASSTQQSSEDDAQKDDEPQPDWANGSFSTDDQNLNGSSV